MSHTVFDELFQKFKQKFPPAADSSQASLKLSSSEFIDTFTEIFGEVELEDGWFNYLTNQGYKCEPIEQNDQVHFKWLVKKVE